MNNRESVPRQMFPTGLKTKFITDDALLSFADREKKCLSSLETIRTELRELNRERDLVKQAVDTSRTSFGKNDEFQAFVDRKQELRAKMDKLQLEQSKLSDSRNELQLLGFEIKPIENEIQDLKVKIEEITRSVESLNSQRSALLRECGGYETVTEVDACLAQIEEQLDNVKKSSQPQTLQSLTRQKVAAEKAKKNVMATYQLDDRIAKEAKRQVALKKALESKEGQLKSLSEHRATLREKLDSGKTIDDEFKKIKNEISEINKKLDAIQANKKKLAEASEAPANEAKQAVATLQSKQRELFSKRDSILAELKEISNIVQTKHTKEVKYNPLYRRHLIGRNGATLDTLMQDFGVALYLDGAGRDSGLGLIFGSPESIEACVSAIEKIVADAESSDKNDEMVFDPSLTKILIGAKGSTVDKLQSTSGARITIEGDKIKLNGTQDSIDAAKVLITELFAGNAHEELPFDTSEIDLVIGKGGSVIRQIEKDSGVKSIRADRDRGVLVIAGHQNNVAKAVALYQDILKQAKNKVSIRIPGRMIALVIGPQGKVIKEIQEQTSASINVQNRGNDAVVTFRGSMEAVSEARRRVEDIALRDEVKVTFDSSMSNFLSTRPIEKNENGDDVEKLSPLEAIRFQCECDYVGLLRSEGKIVIRGRPESVGKAKALLLKFLQANVPKTLRISMPVVLMNHLIKRQEGGSLLEKLRTTHSAVISNIEFDRGSKAAILIGQPNVTIGAVNSVAQEMETLIRGLKFTVVPVHPSKCPSIIGTGGKVVSEIQNSTNTIINVDRDAGEVSIFSAVNNAEDVEKAAAVVMNIRDGRDGKQEQIIS